MTHLWEVDHPYYCEQGNYFAKSLDDYYAGYKRWQDFYDAEKDSDFDLNLIFRFDWIEQHDGEPPTYTGDDYYRNGKLFLFFMSQRKGAYRYAEIDVCRADEPAVIAYLQPRFEHMLKLWEPFKT